MSEQRCLQCAAITTEFALSADFERDKIAHHASFSILERSAAAGCDLCQVLRQYLIHHVPNEFDAPAVRLNDLDNQTITISRASKALVLRMGSIHCTLYNGNSGANSLNSKEALSHTKPIHSFKAESCEPDVDKLVSEVIRPWIDRCFFSSGFEKPPDDLHKYCIMRKRGSICHPRIRDLPSLPTRVIDVGPNNENSQTPYLRIRQPWTPQHEYEQDPDCAHHLILSYCWGGSNDAAKTTKANLEERMEKLDVNSFPKTIRDAIQLTKALGERYLFVDAICIVQPSDEGDSSDWIVEASRMYDYYGNALCTIAATGAEDSSSGCFQERVAQRFPVKSCALNPWVTMDKTKTIYIHPSHPTWWNSVHNSPLYRRGWAV